MRGGWSVAESIKWKNVRMLPGLRVCLHKVRRSHRIEVGKGNNIMLELQCTNILTISYEIIL